MFIRPVEGRLVRDPVTKRHLPAAGAEVPESTYWIRRIEGGDVVRTSPDVVSLIQITSDSEST